MGVDAIMDRQALGVAWLPSKEKDPDIVHMWNPGVALQVQSSWR